MSCEPESATQPAEQTSPRRKPIIGLAGGVNSGKSTVARIMGELGAGVISSDELSRQELDANEVKDVLRRWWGDDIFEKDGSVDRARTATIVFGDPAQRHRLEALIHPRVAVRRADKMADFMQSPKVKAIVLDSPLLYETDLDLMCDTVVFVDTSTGVRKERSEKERQWAEGELERREKAQQPLDMKRARADYICENNSTLADLRKHVERVFAQIISESAAS